MEGKETTKYFVSLVISISSSCWMQLGKVQNPITGKIERDLEGAKLSIDMLEMLKEKTKGNLSADEQRVIETTISDLKLNYVDELKKPAEEPKLPETGETEKDKEQK